MTNEAIITGITTELQDHSEAKYHKASQWFFKEGITLYGVRIGIVRKIANHWYTEVKQLPKRELFQLCEALLKRHYQELSVIAYHWALKRSRAFEPSDFVVFERWLKTYVSNWAQCDDLCTGPLGELVARYPDVIQKTVAWRTSRNRWVRRGAAVSLIVPVRKHNILVDVFAAADALLTDSDDLVRKGYGWLLKETSNRYPKEVFQYVMRHRTDMPRVALRYALEKLPATLRKQAMVQG